MNTEKVGRWIDVVLAVAMGLVAWFIGHSGRQQADASERFLPIEAEILESRVQLSVPPHSEPDHAGTDNKGGSFTPVFRYRYEVGGELHEGTRFAYYYTDSRERAYREVENRPQGATVTAYYDPEMPSRAVLYNGLDPQGIRTIVAWGCGAGAVIMILLAFRPRWLRRKPHQT